MYTVLSLFKWVILIYLVKTGRIQQSTLDKCKQLTLSVMTMMLLHSAIVIHLVESVELLTNGTGDGYYLRKTVIATNKEA